MSFGHRFGTFLLICCLAGMIIGKGVTWWLLDRNGPWVLTVGVLLYAVNYLWFHNWEPVETVIEFTLTGVSTKPDCPEETRNSPTVYPICLQLCKELSCKKNPGYKGLTKFPGETEKQFKDRHK